MLLLGQGSCFHFCLLRMAGSFPIRWRAGGGRSGAAITGQHTYYVCCDCDTRGRCLVLEHKRKKNSPVRPSKGREGRKGGLCSVLLPQSPDSTSQDDTAGWGSGCGDRALVAELR